MPAFSGCLLSSKIPYSDQVVDCRRKSKYGPDPFPDPMVEFSQTAYGFHPTENFLDSFAHLQADPVTSMTGGRPSMAEYLRFRAT